MSCRDVQRVVSEYCLFGEQDGLTPPHLEHLSACRSCRDEAGVDRALVRELRRALAARVEGETPSAGVWQAVLRRAQEEPIASGWRAWLRWGQRGPAAVNPFVARLRTASVVSTMALAILIANGQNSMPVLPSAPAPAPEQAGKQWERQLVQPSRTDISLLKPTVARAPAPRSDVEERLFTAPVVYRPAPREAPDAGEAAMEVPSASDEDVRQHVVWQLYPPTLDPASEPASPGHASDRPPPLRSLPGEPS